MQHHAVFEALLKQQSARCEAIMREHANATLSYAEQFDVNGSYKLVDSSQ